MLKKDLKKRLIKIFDNLAHKYSVFYLIKSKPILSSILLLIYTAFVIYIFADIYYTAKWPGIVQNIFPFFVDIAIIFIITLLIIVAKIFFNDEKVRIDYSKNSLITYKKFLDIDVKNSTVFLNLKDFYSQPPILENLLKWVDFDKDEFFRIHHGSLDIAKFALKNLEVTDNQLKLNCGMCSFYDITYTHYFPDYEISYNSSNEKMNSKKTLRHFFYPNAFEYYKLQSNKFILKNKISLFDVFPNPLGITGIVILKYKNKKFIIFQLRHKTEAASRNRIQWSYAGTIDIIPNLYKEKLSLKELIDTELDDEVINKLKISKNIKLSKIIGFVLNDLYLFQPEFFILHEIELTDDDYNKIKNKINKIPLKENQIKMATDDDTLMIFEYNDCLELMKFIRSNYERRILFKYGLKFLHKFYKNNPIYK